MKIAAHQQKICLTVLTYWKMMLVVSVHVGTIHSDESVRSKASVSPFNLCFNAWAYNAHDV